MTLTTAVLMARGNTGGVTDPEIDAKPKRRTFTAAYKAGVLAEYEALASHSPLRGALLRREGLYSSHLAEWRKLRDAGVLAGLESKVPGPKRDPRDGELDRQRQRIDRLETELARTKLALEITGKAHALLEMLSESADIESRPIR